MKHWEANGRYIAAFIAFVIIKLVYKIIGRQQQKRRNVVHNDRMSIQYLPNHKLWTWIIKCKRYTCSRSTTSINIIQYLKASFVPENTTIDIPSEFDVSFI